MVNTCRGEIEAELDGRACRLCLTLGALAELEAAFGDADLLALAARFENGRMKATDIIKIIGAGLRGGGMDIADDAVARLGTSRGAAGFVDIVARLLTATFGAGASPPQSAPALGSSAPSDGGGGSPAPFPGSA